MSSKRSGTPAHKEGLVDNLREAARSYIEAYGGKAKIDRIEIVTHTVASFDVVIHCVGRRPAELKN